MPLPLVADSLDAIPEGARGAYVERDGKHYLDATIEDTTGLKTKNTELVGKLTAAQKRAKELEDRAAVLGDRTIEDVQADLELAAKSKEDRAKAEGNFTALTAEMAAKHAKEKAKLEADLNATNVRIRDKEKRQAATEAILAAGGKVKKLLEPVMRSLDVVDQDGELAVQVVDAKGNPRIADGSGVTMTVAQLVETFRADEDYAVDFTASTANGGGARNDSSGRQTGAVVLIPKDATPQQYRQMKADAEKRGVPYRIAG